MIRFMYANAQGEMMAKETNTPRPRCGTCGKSTVRAHTENGKGRYTCSDPQCPESFKKYYVRESGEDDGVQPE